MRRKFFTDSSIMDSLDELSKKKLSKNLKNLLYVSDSDWKRSNSLYLWSLFTVVLSFAEGSRVVESIYRAIRSERPDDDCLIIPKEYEISSGMFWLFYHILTFYLPTVMMIRLLWISADEITFNRHNEVFLSLFLRFSRMKIL